MGAAPCLRWSPEQRFSAPAPPKIVTDCNNAFVGQTPIQIGARGESGITPDWSREVQRHALPTGTPLPRRRLHASRLSPLSQTRLPGAARGQGARRPIFSFPDLLRVVAGRSISPPQRPLRRRYRFASPATPINREGSFRRADRLRDGSTGRPRRHDRGRRPERC